MAANMTDLSPMEQLEFAIQATKAAIINPTTISLNGYIASQIIIDVVLGAIIALRLWGNISHQRKLHADDYCCLVALAFIIGFAVVSSMLTAALNAPDPNSISLHYLTTIGHATAFMSSCSTYFAKLPLMILLIRTFGTKKWLKYTCYFLIGFTAVGVLACQMPTSAVCVSSPNATDEQLGPLFVVNCYRGTFYTGVSRGSLSMATDVALLILPIPIVMKLNMALHKRIALCGVFFFGSFAIIAGIVSLYFQVGADSQSSSSVVNALLTNSIEFATVLIVGCTAALRSLWGNTLKNYPIFSRFTSQRSLMGGTSSKGQSFKSGSRYHQKLGESSEHIRVTTDRTIELEENMKKGFSPYTVSVTRQEV